MAPSCCAITAARAFENTIPLSTGELIAPVNALRKRQGQLACAQRALSRKKKFYRNWIKAKARVQSLYAKVGHTRRDFQREASTAISKNHAIVVIEDLKVRNMSKSAAGTVEQPGKNVRAKAGLNRSILDQGWGEFRRQLEYKQAWRGGQVIAAPTMNTSRTCPACGHVAAESRATQDRSGASRADTQPRPISTRRTTYWRQGMPSSPVKRERWLPL